VMFLIKRASLFSTSTDFIPLQIAQF